MVGFICRDNKRHGKWLSHSSFRVYCQITVNIQHHLPLFFYNNVKNITKMENLELANSQYVSHRGGHKAAHGPHNRGGSRNGVRGKL